MTDEERRRKEGLASTAQYAADNPADFPSGSVEATQIAAINTELGQLDGFAVDQAFGAGEASSSFVTKDTARENLRDEMVPFSRLARVMEHAITGIAAIFRMPRNRSDQEMLATARAWAIAAGAYESDFIAYGMPHSFIADLIAAADAFEASFGATTTSTDARVAATAQIGESIRRAMIAHRIVVEVMRLKYAADPGKLAAWNSASHIEKAPKHKPTPTPPTP